MKRIDRDYLKAGTILILASILAISTFTGCQNLNNTAKGGIIGAGAGAAVGSVIGGRSGEAGKGAVIGGAVGAAVGAVIGRQMDKQAEELEEELEGAEIVRVDDQIQITFESAILFEFGKSDLLPNAKINLDNLAQSMQIYDNTEVIIVGHTDSVGQEEFNQRLSEQRAGSVASYLLAKGIDNSRMLTEGRGEMEPVATNETAEGRQQNRRVELYIQVTEEYRQQLEAEEAARQEQEGMN